MQMLDRLELREQAKESFGPVESSPPDSMYSLLGNFSQWPWIVMTLNSNAY